MNQQSRFVLFVVLSLGMILGWNLFFAPPPAAIEAPAIEERRGAQGPEASAEVVSAPSAPTKAIARPARQIPISVQPLATDQIQAAMTNRGARLTSLRVTEPERYANAGDLLAGYPEEETAERSLGLKFERGAVALPAGAVYEVVSADPRALLYRYTDPAGRFRVEKSVRARDDEPYVFDLDVTITNTASTGTLSDAPRMIMTGPKDLEQESSFLDFRPDEVEALCYVDGSMERALYSSLEDPEEFRGPVRWGGVNTRYFLWALIPQSAPVGCRMSAKGGVLTSELIWGAFSLEPGQSKIYEHTLYLGPKDLDLMEQVDEKLTESVDYGLLTIMAKPLRWSLNWIQSFVVNWGLAIIVLTLIIKLMTWPLMEKSYASGEKMRVVQPKMAEIKKRYADDQQRQQEEIFKLMRESGANPLGGCLPILVTMPILYGLYVMIMYSAELYYAPFFGWYTDLSAKDPYFVLPILLGITQFVQMRFMTPQSAAADDQQKAMQSMMRFMPIFMTAVMLFLPAGLVLYYFLSTLIGVAQQLLIRRKFARRRAQPEVV